MKNKQRIKGFGLLTLSLVLLFNPNVRVIDILPDFISYFILMRMMTHIADKVPYFAELRASVKKLFIFSLLRIPAQFIITLAQSKDTSDVYMKALMTFIFSVVELLLLWCAVTDLFRALVYMGSRSDNAALIVPFKITKSKYMSVDGLKILSYAFVIIKCTLTTIPELFIIFYDSLMAPTSFQAKMLSTYPYAVVFGILVTSAVGLFWLTASLKYARAASEDGKFSEAVDCFMTPEKVEFVRKKVFLRKRVSALNFIILGTVLSFDLVFSDFNYVDLLPNFIGILVISFGYLSLMKNKDDGYITCSVEISKGDSARSGRLKGQRVFKAVALTYAAVALVSYISSVVFLSKYTYSDFSNAWSNAKEAYIPVIVCSVLELIAAAVFYICFAKRMSKYVLDCTGISPSSDRYTMSDKYRHAAFIKSGYVFAVLGIITNAAKCADVFLHGDIKYRAVESQGHKVNLIFMTSVPWFGLVITALTAIFVGYAIYYIGLLKDDARIKYEEEE